MLFWQLYFSPELHGMILELSLVKASYGQNSAHRIAAGNMGSFA